MHHRLYILTTAVSALCVFLTGCANKNEPTPFEKPLSDTNNPALVWILNGDYKVVKSFYELPKDVRIVIIPEPYEFSQKMIDSLRKSGWTEEQIKKHKEDIKIVDGRMANPNERFNGTDVIEEDLPMQRFITGGFSDSYAFVFYEQGGFIYSQPLVVMRRNGGKANIIFSGNGGGKTLDNLKSFIKKGKITLSR
jgi:hypothetical protein